MKKSSKIKFKKNERPTIHTSGKGLWSTEEKEVKVRAVEWYTNERDEVFVQVYLDGWKNMEDGLVYTDPLFIKEIRPVLKKILPPEFDTETADYTEQGMQGGCMNCCPEGCDEHEEYVHLILGEW